MTGRSGGGDNFFIVWNDLSSQKGGTAFDVQGQLWFHVCSLHVFSIIFPLGLSSTEWSYQFVGLM